MIRGINNRRRFTTAIGKGASEETIRRYCGELWSDIVKTRDMNKCVICGGTNKIDSHHLISRQILECKYDINCGVTLCRECHVLSPYVSPHYAPWNFEKIIKEKRPEQYKWWLSNRINLPNPTTKPNYMSIFNKLVTLYNNSFFDYKNTKNGNGRYKMLNKDESMAIVEDYKMGMSKNDISNKYNINNNHLYNILNNFKIEIRREPHKQKTKEDINKLRNKFGVSVQQIDKKSGNVIKTFCSVGEAAEHLGQCKSSIGNCIAGRSKSCAGFCWRKTQKTQNTQELKFDTTIPVDPQVSLQPPDQNPQ